MNGHLPKPMRWLVALIVLVVFAGGCGDDSDALPTPGGDAPTTDSGDTTPEGGVEIAGTLSDDDLVVPRAYLQGEWCDSDGESWSIEGDIATLTDSSSGATVDFPVDLLFIDDVETELVSQTDNEFVFGSEFEEVTFTRGPC